MWFPKSFSTHNKFPVIALFVPISMVCKVFLKMENWHAFSVEGKQPKQLLQLMILNLFYIVPDGESASIRTKLELSIRYSLNIFEKITTKFGH